MLFICRLTRAALVFDYMELPVITIIEHLKKRFRFVPFKKTKFILDVLLNRILGLSDGLIVVHTRKNELYAK